MSGVNRWERSPTPVSVGVKTSCPFACNELRTRFQHQLPYHAPWTSRNDVIDDLLALPFALHFRKRMTCSDALGPWNRVVPPERIEPSRGSDWLDAREQMRPPWKPKSRGACRARAHSRVCLADRVRRFT